MTRYVDANCPNPQPPYTNWATAAVTIKDAINAALPEDQILVTNGTYSAGTTVSDAGTNRVTVTNIVSVHSVNGPQFTMIDGGGSVRCVYLMDGGSLSGFTLTNGVALGGGGVMCESEGAFLSNCVLAGNSAPGYLGGGALSGTLVNCVLTDNVADLGGGAFGCTLNACMLIGNTALGEGGGAYGGVLNRCTVSGNTAAYGGGIAVAQANNCQVTGNSADGGGGTYGSELKNCTVTGNSADFGGGTLDGVLNNCIVYFNTAALQGANYFYNFESYVEYCCTTPMPTNGVGNISDVPLFVDSNNWVNLRLQSNSPCINAGNNVSVLGITDLDGRPRIMSGTVDIGAYEFEPGVSGEFLGWLQQYRLPTDGSADYSDADTDNMNNWQEWIAGTVPTDATSALRLLNPTDDTSGLLVSWQSVSNRTYFLERATDLGATPSFSLLTSNLIGQTGTTSYVDTNAVGPGAFFYRVVIQQ